MAGPVGRTRRTPRSARAPERSCGGPAESPSRPSRGDRRARPDRRRPALPGSPVRLQPPQLGLQPDDLRVDRVDGQHLVLGGRVEAEEAGAAGHDREDPVDLFELAELAEGVGDDAAESALDDPPRAGLAHAEVPADLGVRQAGLAELERSGFPLAGGDSHVTGGHLAPLWLAPWAHADRRPLRTLVASS